MVPDFDDKDLVIICATLIAIISIFGIAEDPSTIVTSVVSGLFGVAVGKSVK